MSKIDRSVPISNCFHLVPPDWAWWLRNFRGHGPSIGWPEANVEATPEMAVAAE